MKATWLLVANRSRARLFQLPSEGDELSHAAGAVLYMAAFVALVLSTLVDRR